MVINDVEGKCQSGGVMNFRVVREASLALSANGNNNGINLTGLAYKIGKGHHIKSQPQ